MIIAVKTQSKRALHYVWRLTNVPMNQIDVRPCDGGQVFRIPDDTLVDPEAVARVVERRCNNGT